MKIFAHVSLLLAFCCHSALALEFSLPAAGDDIVGQVQTVSAQKGDNLAQIGRRYDIGYAEMVEANEALPRDKALPPGAEVVVPRQFILPKIRQGIVANLAELRLYYFPAGQKTVYTFPFAAGRQGWNTPLAITEVIRKAANPVWIVPPSIMADSLRHGKKLKPVYKGDDPENPLGHYALYLGEEGIRVHGTLAPRSIGRRASHGCLRIWDDDIEFLYNTVPVGTPFVIEHEEAKAGWRDHVLYLEVDSPFAEYHEADAVSKALDQATAAHPATIDWQKVDQVSADQQGIPVAVGYDASRTALPN